MTPNDLLRATRASIHPGSASVITIPSDDPEIAIVEISPFVHYFAAFQIAFPTTRREGASRAEQRSFVADEIIRCAPWAASDELLAAHTRAQLLTHAIQESYK